MTDDPVTTQDASQHGDHEKRRAEFVAIWASVAARVLQSRAQAAQVYPEGLLARDAHAANGRLQEEASDACEGPGEAESQ